MYNEADLDIILSDIDNILQNANCDGIVLGGDLNSDFSHHSIFVNNINMFINKHDLQCFGICLMSIIPTGIQMEEVLPPFIILLSQIGFLINFLNSHNHST